ncbi:unnamed protein product [Psylliodes chrysocephalus]|uniref:C2H2-type domain-containing protein n=1 Tax=Psylliodes chrysocephalus TaxID=3402493 RepID=A0A9P0CSP8_9CUCU|nr:unnamed protein product [Psylliodes chrysocephala]
MEQQEYIMSEDMNFQSFNDVIPAEGTIKREELKDEYDIFLFAHLDNITNNLDSGSNDLPFTPEMDMSQQMRDQVSEQPTIENESNNVDDKDSEELNISLLKDQGPDMNGNSTSHFVRYKLQNGKHVKMWVCGICQKVFTHQYTLMRHLPTHTDERKFQCITCGKAFRQMSTLSQHRAIHSTERPYICEICQKTFNRVSTLISHRKTHTGLKPHRCHLCTKAFHQKGNLRNHIFTHTNERPYKCDICGNGFNQMSNLMCHKLKAHQKTEKPKYVCHVCGKSFAKRVGLRQHEQYTHKMVNPLTPPPVASQLPEKMSYTNSIIVEPIKTEAMRLAVESNQTPFALLRPVTGIPVLVRVLPAGDKQMLVPASAEDLRKHSHISIMAKGEKATPYGKQTGSTVQIKIPVVATVIQQNDQAGQMSMSVVSPGPNGELDGDQIGLMGSKVNNFVYSSTLTHCSASTSSAAETSNNELNIEDMPISGDFTQSGLLHDVAIEFLDEHGRRVQENEFQNQLGVGMNNGIIYQTKDGDAVVTATVSTVPASLSSEDVNGTFTNNALSLPLL